MKRNCANCTHLEYYEGNEYEGEGPNGYFCNGRDYSIYNEHDHLMLLDNDEYRAKAKSCCVLRERNGGE